MKILITGASGFIGSHIAEEALRQGMDVWCAVRKSTSRRYLADSRLNFIELNLSSVEQMSEAMKSHQFDYVVHAAGATKCLNINDFYRVNTDGTANLCSVISKTQHALKRFVFVSSLSVFGAIREQEPHTDILPTDTPRPNTAYGKSKLKAESVVEQSGLPYVMLRPTGVYGPREKDYYVMVKSIVQHTDMAVGFSRQDITFVYVDDVVQAVFKALTSSAAVGGKYFLSDGDVYRSTTFSDMIIDELTAISGKRPWVLRMTVPLWLLRIVCTVGEWYAQLTRNIIVLNKDKYNILSQRNWQCDISDARRDLGYEPQVKLREGVRRCVRWYKQEGWI